MASMKKLLRCDTRAARAGVPFFRDGRFLALFTICAIAMDSCSLYTSIDAALGDKVVLTLLLTGGFSMILNVLPTIAGYVATSRRPILQKMILCGIILLTFGFIFVETFQLKMASAPVVYYEQQADDGMTGGITDPAQAEDAEETEEEDAEYALALTEMRHLANVLVGLEPLLTSIACFILSCLCDNRVQKYIKLKKQEVKLVKLAASLEKRILQLENISAPGVMERSAEQAFALANKQTSHRCDQIRRKVQLELARWLGTAKDLTYVTGSRG